MAKAKCPTYLINEVFQFDFGIILFLGRLRPMFAVHGAAWSRDRSRRRLTSGDRRCQARFLILKSIVDSLVKGAYDIMTTNFILSLNKSYLVIQLS